jgi:hypothetical protein
MVLNSPSGASAPWICTAALREGAPGRFWSPTAGSREWMPPSRDEAHRGWSHFGGEWRVCRTVPGRGGAVDLLGWRRLRSSGCESHPAG